MCVCVSFAPLLRYLFKRFLPNLPSFTLTAAQNFFQAPFQPHLSPLVSHTRLGTPLNTLVYQISRAMQQHTDTIGIMQHAGVWWEAVKEWSFFSLLVSVSLLPVHSSASSACLLCVILQSAVFLSLISKQEHKNPPSLSSSVFLQFSFLCLCVLFAVSLFFCPFPHHQLTAIPLSPTAGQINSVPGWGMKGGSRPSASSLSPSPGRVGKMTGRGVGMKALSGHQVYLTSAINPLTVKTLREVYEKDQCCGSKI